jgi:hypothetical protein
VIVVDVENSGLKMVWVSLLQKSDGARFVKVHNDAKNLRVGESLILALFDVLSVPTALDCSKALNISVGVVPEFDFTLNGACLANRAESHWAGAELDEYDLLFRDAHLTFLRTKTTSFSFQYMCRLCK